MKLTLSRITGLSCFMMFAALWVSDRAYPYTNSTIIIPGNDITWNKTTSYANVAPVLSDIESTPLFYSIGTGKITLSNTIAVSDPDNVSLVSATVSITLNYKSTQDKLSFTSAYGIKGSFNSRSGELTLTGKTSLANYQAALRSVKYENTYTSNPNTSDRTVQFRVFDDAAYSKTVSRIITFRPSATISGGGDICGPWQKATIVVTLTGRPNWTITIRRTGGPSPKDTVITGISKSPREFSANLAGTYTLLNVADKNFSSGTVSGKAIITYDLTPKASISGIDTTCSGNEAVLNVQLTGTPPFSITYLRNGANAKTIHNISETNYALKVTGDGTYTLSAVSDPIRSGCVSGTGKVVDYAVPKATLSGTETICQNESANLRVSLTGKAPWTFSYHRNAEAPTIVSNVTASPYYIPVAKAGTYTLVNVSDKYCKGTVSGSAVISVIPTPEVTLSGLLPAYKIDTGSIAITGTPSGGTFSGRGVYTSEGKTYFFPSFAGIGIHTIVYTYLDNNTSCYGYDTALVAVLYAEATITFPNNEKRFYCFNEPPFTVRADNIENSIGTFTISGGFGLVDNHDNTATIDPSQILQGGEYTIFYSYKRQGVWMNVQENFEIEYLTDIWFINFDKLTYCDNDEPIELNGNMPNGIFSGKAVYGNIISGFYFVPQNAIPGLDTVYYTCTTARGCSLQVYEAVTIHDAADINFTVLDTCVTSGTTDSTVFINQTESTDPVLEWLWDFNDLASGINNTSSLKNPKHLYSKAGRRYITLTATTSNCISDNEILFNFGDKPTAGFTWESECFQDGQEVKFSNSSVVDEGIINYNKWRFYSGQSYDSSLTQNASHTYGAPGIYDVSLYIRTNYGCTDTLRKTLPLRPIYQLSDGAPYSENFENGMAGWFSGSSPASKTNSWSFGIPLAFADAARSESYAWYTNIITQPAPMEQSWVTSPCFDFTGINKPMIKLWVKRLFSSDRRDGAVLQYKADSSTKWERIGDADVNDGINWYLDYSITGNPGGEAIGWSAKTIDQNWVETRHSMDELRGKKNIQLRIAYGSDGTARNTNGIAFDDIWIGERNKIVLLEHFTNASVSAARSADSTLDALTQKYPLDIIDIQYHTSFPGADPFNDQNADDPEARAAYYSLSTVPISILNGGASSGFRFDYDDKPLDPALVKIQSLTEPKFSITLTTQKLDNSLTIDVNLKPLDVIMNRQVTLHIAIIERTISGIAGTAGDTLFKSVLKTIKSSTSYTNNWNPEWDSENIIENWTFKNTYNTDEIRVIAFIQDEGTKEIYQAMIDEFDVPMTLDDENTIHPGDGSNGFIVFPNPACNLVYLRFDEAPDKKAKVDLFDINCKLIMTKELFPGIKLYEVAIEDYPDGFYFVRITSDNQFIGLRKLIISRQKAPNH